MKVRVRGKVTWCSVLLLIVCSVQTGWPQQGENAAPVEQPQAPAGPAPASPNQSASPQPAAPDASPSNSGGAEHGVPAEAQTPSQSQEPVGTAVAPYEKVTGAPASRPAGAAIAPGKQRRVRSILIKVGILVAAGVAIGTVIALSNGSSSKPH